MKKSVLSAAAAVTVSAMLLSAPAYANEISINVNGEKIETQTPAVIMDGRTLVPLRAVSEALGCAVSWDAETKGITLCDGYSLYFAWIGRDHVFKTSALAWEGSAVMDVPPAIMNDYTMVPIRAISEMFGAQVDWDETSSTVIVNYEKTSVQEGITEKFMTYEKLFDRQYDTYKGYADGTGRTVNAEIQLENGGVIGLELYPDIAPLTVNNFVTLANNGFYNGLIFHRVIKDFMIQGGGFDTSINQIPSQEIKGEFIQNGYFNMIPHERGVISMARTNQNMDSASSQFFIMHADADSLNGQYAAFGKVTSGMEYVDAIANVQTKSIPELRMDDIPVDNQVIKTIVIK